MTRYSRQIAVSELGREGQARLQTSAVLVIGAGGLAAPVLQYLVGAGVGKIRIVDPDLVEISNFHRQTLFRQSDIGTAKAIAAERHMTALNEAVALEGLVKRFDPASARELCSGMNLVLDCADSFAASYIASDFCKTAGLPLVSASVVEMEGYCGGFCGPAPSLRAVFPDLPDRLQSCDADGVLGPSVGVIGSIQAQMALSVLSNMEPSPLGQLVNYNAKNMRVSGFRFDNATEGKPGPLFICESDICNKDIVVDLRREDEPGPKLQSNLRLTVPDVGPENLQPRDDQRLVFACRSGLRAWQAAERMSHFWNGETALVALGDIEAQ